jgi:hypothetical protein
LDAEALLLQHTGGLLHLLGVEQFHFKRHFLYVILQEDFYKSLDFWQNVTSAECGRDRLLPKKSRQVLDFRVAQISQK